MTRPAPRPQYRSTDYTLKYQVRKIYQGSIRSCLWLSLIGFFVPELTAVVISRAQGGRDGIHVYMRR